MKGMVLGMKVNELRKIIGKSKKAELEVLLVEIYKQIPKNIREEKEIDLLIENPDYFKNKKSNTKKGGQSVSFETLRYEAQHFLVHAYEQNYVVPNRIIPKKQRANWRFTAKRLVDQVTSFLGDPIHMKEASTLLEALYVLFTYASGHYVFTSDVPFHTIKITQPDFFARVIAAKKQLEPTDEWIRNVMLLIVENEVDYGTLYVSLMVSFHDSLNNAVIRERALHICKEIFKEKKKTLNKQSPYPELRAFSLIIEMIFILHSSLSEFDEANKFFQKNYKDEVGEEKLFIHLSLIKAWQRPEDWMKVYESAIAKHVDLGGRLSDTYKEIKRTNKFPEHITSY